MEGVTQLEKKPSGFGTRVGFELAAAGSAVGLGNIWGFPYKTSANGGAAYLFVYLLCILLIGAVAMLAEFQIGRNARANPVSAMKAVSPKLGAFGLLAVLIPVLIMCYYFVLGGYTLKYALSSFSGNTGMFPTFTANTGDVILHTALFALAAFAIVSAGVRGGIEKSSKILIPTMLVSLIVISCFTLMLGSGVKEGLAFYLKPDFRALTWSGVLSAMGQAFFSLSLGCGAMISYGSYTGRKVNLLRSTAVICLIDAVITFMIGLAIFPALFHYIAVSGIPAAELGMGGIGLVFITLPMVFEEMPYIGACVSLLFFGMTAIAALTSVISILEVATQFVLQCYRLYRGHAALLITCFCVILSIPVGLSIGSSFAGGNFLQFHGRNLLELLDAVTNTILMPVCALAACVAAGWFLKEKLSPAVSVMMKFITPLLIILIELFGVMDLAGSYGGTAVLGAALAVLLAAFLAYYALYRKRDTGSNDVEAAVFAQELKRRKDGPARSWQRKE